MNKSTSPNIKGFTLLEILVAMAILATVLSLIYASFTKTLAEMNETTFEADIYQMARLTLERVRDDLECSILLNDKKEISEDLEDLSGTVDFLGKNEEIDGRDAGSLIFLSTKNLSLNDENNYSGLNRIAFYVKKNDDDEAFALYRSGTPEIENAPEGQTGGLILCDRLFSVKFTYYDSEGEEFDEWNSAEGESKGQLPSMVAIQLSFINKSYPEDPLKFQTGVALPTAINKNGKES